MLERLNEWEDGWMEWWMNEKTDGLNGKWMEGWMDGMVDG